MTNGEKEICPVMRANGIKHNSLYGGREICENCKKPECIYDTVYKKYSKIASGKKDGSQ